jgi:predicted TIM-barrel fold metal-dependent hydrolase
MPDYQDCGESHPEAVNEFHQPSRRELFRSLAAGAALLGVRRSLYAQSNPRRVDVHHHFQPPVDGNNGLKWWTPEKSLEMMDKNGIAFAMMSNPGASANGYDGTPKGNDVVRRSNEFGAKLVTQYPKRIGLFAAIPMNNTDGALKEIEYALDTLHADGFQIGSSTGDKWPGDPQYLPIFQEISRRKASVFVHPYVNKCCKVLMPGIPESVVEYDFDTTRCITSMLYNGTLSACPDMKFIVNHSGAAVPMLAGRIKDRVPGAQTSNFGTPKTNSDGINPKIPKGVFYELRKLYYECAHAAYPFPMAAMMKLAPSTQYLFGTDYPAEPMESTLDHLPENDLSAAVQRAMNRENAERLYPRLKNL